MLLTQNRRVRSVTWGMMIMHIHTDARSTTLTGKQSVYTYWVVLEDTKPETVTITAHTYVHTYTRAHKMCSTSLGMRLYEHYNNNNTAGLTLCCDVSWLQQHNHEICHQVGRTQVHEPVHRLVDIRKHTAQHLICGRKDHHARPGMAGGEQFSILRIYRGFLGHSSTYSKSSRLPHSVDLIMHETLLPGTFLGSAKAVC